MRSVASSVVKKFAKKSGEKALKSVSEKVGKKTSEKQGDLIMERLGNMRIGNAREKALTPPIKQQKREESIDMTIDRLISGSGIKRRSRVKVM